MRGKLGKTLVDTWVLASDSRLKANINLMSCIDRGWKGRGKIIKPQKLKQQGVRGGKKKMITLFDWQDTPQWGAPGRDRWWQKRKGWSCSVRQHSASENPEWTQKNTKLLLSLCSVSREAVKLLSHLFWIRHESFSARCALTFVLERTHMRLECRRGVIHCWVAG